MIKKIAGIAGAAGLLIASAASAHVVVRPNQAGMGAFTTFNVSVPSEKSFETVSLRLVLPAGLNYVTPTVKLGWKITVKKSGEGEGAKPTEISWTGGSVPAGERDDFGFSAQVPASEGTLQWKAYQTYADGSVVSWDHDPKAEQPKNAEGKADFSQVGPFSETKIINDLAPAKSGFEVPGTWTLALSILALILSAAALVRARR